MADLEPDILDAALPSQPEVMPEPIVAPVEPEVVTPAPYTLPTEISKAKPVFLVNPETQKTFRVWEPEKAKELVESGWGPENKEQLLNRVAKNVVKDNPISTGLLTFASQASNQALLGLPQAINERASDPEQDAITKATYKAMADEHPVMNIAGGVVGTAASLLLTPMGKALDLFGNTAVKTVQTVAAAAGETAAKVAAGKIAQTAVKYGTENAILSIPYRVTEEVLGDPNIASEGILGHVVNTAKGVGNVVKEVAGDAAIGAAFGSGISLLGSTIKGAADLAGARPVIDFMKEKSKYFQFKNTGALKPQFNQLEAVTRKLDRPGQIQAVTELLDEHAGPIAQFFGPGAIEKKLLAARKKIGDRLNTIRNVGDAAVPNGMVKYQDVANGLDQLEIQYSKGIAPGSSRAIDYSSPAAYQEAIKKYGKDTTKWPTSEIVPGIVDPRATADLKAIQFVRESWQSEALKKLQAQGMSKEDAAKAIAEGRFPTFTLNETHNFRQSVKDELFKVEKANGVKTAAGTQSFTLIRDVMDNGVTSLAKATKDPRLLKTLTETNKEWQKLHPLIKNIISPAAESAEARNKIGLGAVFSALGGVGQFTFAMAKQFLGNYAMYQSLGAAAHVLDNASANISSAIDRSINTDTGKALGLGAVSIWERYTGEKGIDPRKAFDKIQNDLNLVASKPEAIAQSLQNLTPELNEHAPQNFAAMGATSQNAAKYLKDSAPKPPQPIYPGGPIRPWKPSDNELSKYSRRLNAVMNPTSILDEIKTGTLSKESVEAVKTVYPNLYGAIQTELKKKLANASPSQVYKMRSKLRLILEDNEDPVASATRRQGLQAGFAPNNTKVQPRANSKIDESGRYETPLSRILR